MAKYCMISQPMNGLTDEEILDTKYKASKVVTNAGYEVLNTCFVESFRLNEDGNPHVNIPVAFLAKAIAVMARCHAVYFCKGWEKARGCLIEHEIAQKYGIKCLYEED